MSKKKPLNVDLLDKLASAINERVGGDLANFLDDLAVLGGKPAFGDPKKGAGVVLICKMAGVEGAPARGVPDSSGQKWAALVNWANAARRAINQEAA